MITSVPAHTAAIAVNIAASIADRAMKTASKRLQYEKALASKQSKQSKQSKLGQAISNVCVIESTTYTENERLEFAQRSLQFAKLQTANT